MATQIQLRRGTAAQHASFTGAASEITFDTSNTTVRIHDGSTAGGFKLATENRVSTLVNDRLQVANATATFSTLTQLGNTNSYIATTQSNLDTQTTRINLVNTNLTATNTAIRSLVSDRLQVANANQTFVTKSTALSSNNTLVNLINDRMQVANVSSLVSTEVSNLVDSAPEALNTLNELAAALGDDANFASTTTALIGTKAANTYVNQTFETKAVALTSNNAQNVLIDDRIQVANARVEFIQSSNTSVTDDATSITVQQSNVDLEDRALVNPAGFLTLNIGGTDYKLPFFS